MKKNSKLKPILIIVSVIALLILVAGLNRPVASPFQSTIEFEDVTAMSHSDDVTVIADSQNKRLLFCENAAGTEESANADTAADGNAQSATPVVKKIVELDRAGSPFERVTGISIYGDCVYVAGLKLISSGTFIASEQIAVYDLNGNYSGTVYETTYGADSFITVPQIRQLVVNSDGFYIIYTKDNVLELQELDLESAQTSTLHTWDLPETIYHAHYDPTQDAIIGISRTQNYYKADPATGELAQISGDDYIESIKEYLNDTDIYDHYKVSSITYNGSEAAYGNIVALYGDSAMISTQPEGSTKLSLTEFNQVGVGAWLRISGGFHYFAIIWLAAMILALMVYYCTRQERDRKKLSLLAVIVLLLITVVYFTATTYKQAENNYKNTALTESRIATDLVAPVVKNGADYCLAEENNETIEKLQSQLENICNATGTDTSLYSKVFVYNADGTATSLLDSTRRFYTGITVDGYNDPEAAFGATAGTIIFTSTLQNDSYIVYNKIYSDDGSLAGLVITGFYADSLIAQQSALGLDMFINLSTIFIGLYMLSSVAMTFYADFKRRGSRDKDDFDNRSADIAGIYIFIKDIANSMDGVILVFVAQSLCVDMDPVKAAALVALPLTAQSVGQWLGTFFASPLSKKLGERKLSYISTILGIGAMLLCVLSVATSSIMLFTLGKLLSGLIFSGFMYVIGETIPFNSKNEETKKAAMASTKSSGYAAGIISTLLGAYISKYLSYSMIYLIAAVLTVPLFFVTPLVFAKKSDKTDEDNAVVNEASEVNETAKKNPWTFWIKPSSIIYILLYMFPRILLTGYNSYLLPLYTSSAGISELLLSNLSVYSRTITYSLTGTLRKISDALPKTVTMIGAQLTISSMLILFLISPNVYWALLVMFIASLCSQLTTNVATLFVGDEATAAGYDDKTEVSNYYTVYSAVGCTKSQILSAFISLGMNVACAAVGAVTAVLFAIYSLYLKFRKK